MFTFKPWLAVAAGACAFAAPTPSRASVVISGTRIVYAQRDREVTVRLTNDGQIPALVQVWFDRGDPNADPAAVSVPFTLTPPMFRIDPTKGQSLRIIYTQEPLLTDRESVFWLNVLEVPPRASTPGTNSMQLAFRSRIKLFFRPAGLAGNAEDAPNKLQWTLVSNAAGSKILRVANPTPYHVSFSSAEVTIGGITFENHTGGMVAPEASFDFPVARAQTQSPANRAQPVHFTWLNDYGASVHAQAALGSNL